MAGFYPDVPAPRVPYDRDGSVGFIVATSGSVSFMTPAQLAVLNNESTDSVGGGVFPSYYGIVFAQPMDISGVFFTRFSPWSNVVTSSTDTTNGADGNWTSHGTYQLRSSSQIPLYYRSNIESITANGIKGIRIALGGQGMDTAAMHLYGKPTSFAGFDTLRIWHPTLDEPLDDNTPADGAHLDWGDVPQGSTADGTFRIRNNSATLTANSVILSTQVPTNPTPSIASMISYSNGGAFTPSLDIGNLTPGQTSSMITCRKATDISSVPGLWTWRTNAEATSWS